MERSGVLPSPRETGAGPERNRHMDAGAMDCGRCVEGFAASSDGKVAEVISTEEA